MALKYHLHTIGYDTACGLGGGRYRNNLKKEDFKRMPKNLICKRCWAILKKNTFNHPNT